MHSLPTVFGYVLKQIRSFHAKIFKRTRSRSFSVALKRSIDYRTQSQFPNLINHFPAEQFFPCRLVCRVYSLPTFSRRENPRLCFRAQVLLFQFFPQVFKNFFGWNAFFFCRFLQTCFRFFHIFIARFDVRSEKVVSHKICAATMSLPYKATDLSKIAVARIPAHGKFPIRIAARRRYRKTHGIRLHRQKGFEVLPRITNRNRFLFG